DFHVTGVQTCALPICSYVLVVLKTGPTPVTDAEARKAMFAGHFANMERLSESGKLVVAGPFSKDPDGWRGLFVFAVDSVEEARKIGRASCRERADMQA